MLEPGSDMPGAVGMEPARVYAVRGQKMMGRN